MKRHLLLERKAMTNLDSILKSRDITLPTKVCIVKAMVFPVVMYGCENWTIKKAVDVQSLSRVRLFATPWTSCQVSLLKLMSIESVMPSKHLILCHPLLLLPSSFPNIKVFSNKWFFASGGQSTGASASASVFPVNIQDWFPLGLTGLISLQSKGLSTHRTCRTHVCCCCC